MESVGQSATTQNQMSMKSIKNKYKQQKQSDTTTTSTKELESNAEKSTTSNAYTIPRQQSMPVKRQLTTERQASVHQTHALPPKPADVEETQTLGK